jgi:hypothetical protein
MLVIGVEVLTASHHISRKIDVSVQHDRAGHRFVHSEQMAHVQDESISLRKRFRSQADIKEATARQMSIRAEPIYANHSQTRKDPQIGCTDEYAMPENDP